MSRTWIVCPTGPEKISVAIRKPGGVSIDDVTKQAPGYAHAGVGGNDAHDNRIQRGFFCAQVQVRDGAYGTERGGCAVRGGRHALENFGDCDEASRARLGSAYLMMTD